MLQRIGIDVDGYGRILGSRDVAQPDFADPLRTERRKPAGETRGKVQSTEGQAELRGVSGLVDAAYCDPRLPIGLEQKYRIIR